jgi:hypothetical protein
MRCLLPILLLLLAFVTSASAITFNDGLTHIIDSQNSFPVEGVIISDGPGSTSTVVAIVAGGSIATIIAEPSTVSGSSVLEISGGTIGGVVTSLDSSQILLSSGGSAGSFTPGGSSSVIVTGGNLSGGIQPLTDARAIVEVTGGLIAGVVVAQGSSSVTFAGGSVAGEIIGANSTAHLTIYAPTEGRSVVGIEEAVVEVFGGTFSDDILATGASSMMLVDGTFQGNAEISGTAEFFMLGGEIFGDTTVRDTARFEVTGGTLHGMLRALTNSETVIETIDLNYPPGPIEDTQGTLIGRFADGSLINIPFERASTATITVPEPGSDLLATAALMALGLLARVRWTQGAPARTGGAWNRLPTRSESLAGSPSV